MKKQIINHAKKCGDHECCGLVINNHIYLACNNIAHDRKNYFQISIDDWIKAETLGTITAIVHSHPSGIPVLSEADQTYQQKTAIDWWLVCNEKIHKFRYMQPLIGREYQHGETDCYTLIRDAYHLCNIQLPDYKRKDNWWDEGQNLYIDNMESSGFYEINISNLQAGDIILYSLNSKIVNHAVIYIDNNFILHHLPKRQSKRDLFKGYWSRNYHSIWRCRKWRSLNFTAILNNMAINTK